MKKIYSLSQEYGFKIIEDASHAIGGKYLEKPIGGCQFSDITVFSFHPVKIISTAEGGLATTNSKEIVEKMQLFRSHGITRDKTLMKGVMDGDWCYQQVDLGFNYRMTELQAALGISQMHRLDQFVSSRHKLRKKYDSLLSFLPVIRPFQEQDSYSSFHLYPIQINLEVVKKNRKHIFDELRNKGIGVNVHYIPIHLQPYYSKLGFKVGDFPNAEAYYKRVISIPLFHSMTSEQQDEVCKSMEQVLQ